MDAGRPGTVAEPPRCRARQLDQPCAPLDDDDLGQWSGVLLSSGIEGVQARNEEIRIPSPVWMMRSDEIPAAAPDFTSLSFVHASLSFVHLRNGGHLSPRPGAGQFPETGSG